MMKLFVSARSPFARRVRLALNRAGLPCEEVVLNVFEEQPELISANPLGLVPTLVTDDSQNGSPGVITDSTLILEWIHLRTGKVWVDQHPLGFAQRQLSVWCAGVMQCAVSHYIEMSAHSTPAQDWIADYETATLRTLDRLKQLDGRVWMTDTEIFQPGWDLAVMIQYLDLRMPALMATITMNHDWKVLLDRCHQDSEFVRTIPKN